MSKAVYISLIIFVLAETSLAVDNRLVTIGILSQPASDSLRLQYYHPTENWTYVAGSYVDWIGSSGAVPVLIPFDLETPELDEMLDNLDGFVLPGGASGLVRKEDSLPTMYQRVSEHIVNWSIKMHDAGRFFPVYATCLGQESLIYQFTGDPLILECDLENEKHTSSVQTLPTFDRSPF